MGFGRVRTFVRVGVVVAVVGTGIVWEAGGAQAASFTSPPTRLYMAPDGTTLFAGLLGVPIGTLEFGPGDDDPISGDTRDITVAAEVGPLLCDTINDKPIGVKDYDIDDCPRLQMDVIHGRLKLETAEQLFRDYLTDPDGGGPLMAGDENENDVVWRLPGGAIVSSIGGGGNPDTPNDPDGHTAYDLSGTEDQINAALDGMSYIPDDGYYYTNSAPEERLSMDIVSGDPNVGSSSHDVEIRVLDVNDAASLEGPASASAEPQIELLIPSVTPGNSWPYTGSEWTVADEDNDEIVDDDTGETLADGADTKMLLVGYLDCPPEAMLVEGSSGFHFRGGSFDLTDDDIEALLTDFYDLTSAPQELQDAVDLLFDALNAIEPGLTNLPLATGNVFDHSRVFAGIDDIDVVAYALSQVHVLIDEPGVTCTLYTVVSDLGNNGLPLQFIGDPPTGVEVPWLGIPPIDIVETEITTGELDEIDVYFDADPLYVDEGVAPIAAEPVLHISPATHPEFTIKWDVNPKVGDLVPPGVAEANVDFQGTFNNTLVIPENATTVSAPPGTNVFPDPDVEGNETFTFDLVLSEPPPPGWTITSSNPQRTVIILDDEDAPAQVDSFTGEDVVEGDSGTTTMTFTITLDKPADGTETIDVAVSGGTAANPSDFGDPVPSTVSFAPGATSATVDVPVAGDTDDEADETIELTLSNPSDVTLPPANATATGTILNDDETRLASIADASVIEGDAGTTTLSFTVSLDQPAKGTESLTVSTADGAPGAVAPGDYTALTNVPVTFDPGQTEATATIDVMVNGDTDAESDETFTLTLSVVSNVGIDDGTAVGTITNDDILVTTDAAASVDENASSTFEIQITPSEHPPFTLTGTLAPITATAGADYDDSVSPITISVPADAATVDVPIAALGDFVVDDGEQYSVEVERDTDPTDFTVRIGSPSLVTVTIDDVPPTDSVLSVADVTVAEGGTASVALTNSFPARACQVSVTTTQVTATPGADYTEINGATIDANGDPILVPTDDDVEIESDETFLVTIALIDPPTPGCVLGDDEATVTITSDDAPMEVSIDDGTVAEGATADLTVHVTDPVTPYCAVTVTTAAVAPTSASDFTAISGATFTADDVDTVTVEAAQDLDDDDGETFTVTLALTGSSDPRCVIVDGQATVTIIDDDGPTDTTTPTVTVNQAAGQADPTSVEPILFTVVFSEPVIGFATGDVTIGGTAGATTAQVTDTGDSTTFTVAVSGMGNDGTVTASVGAGVATDAATNPNEASTSTDNVVTYDFDEGDTTAPTVTVNQAAGQADPTDTSPVLFTVVFSEPVTDFEVADLLLDGTAGPTSASVSGSGATYTVAVSGMPGPGTVIVSVPAGAAVDGSLNASLASTSTDNVVTYEPDVGAPLSIDVPDDIVRGNDPGDAGAVVDFPPATASGGTPPTTVTCDRSSGEFFPLGTTTVNCIATDSESSQQDERFTDATVTASFTITVVDTEPPVIADNPDLVRGATSSTGTTVTFPLPAASDNAGTPAVVCVPASGTQFQVGVSTVTCTATDGAGNTASSSFRITVTSPGSGVPATGSDTAAVLLVAALFLAAGASTRRIARRV